MPLLYFMQAMPLALITEVSAIVYKDLGIGNESITRWTSLIALPWTIKFLWGPLVDLNFTKRQWVVMMQGLITVALMAAPFTLRLPNAFQVSLGVLFISAIFSATCDIATDGYYLLSLSREEQAAYVGILSTSSKLGRLFCIGILVYAAGVLQKSGVPVPDNWIRMTLVGAAFYGLGWLSVAFNFAEPGLGRWQPSPLNETLRWFGRIAAGLAVLAGLAYALPGLYGILGHASWSVSTWFSSSSTWLDNFKEADAMNWVHLLIGGVGALISLALFTGRAYLPRPEADVPAEHHTPGENKLNILRTLAVIAAALTGYFTLNSIVRLGAHILWLVLDGEHYPGQNLQLPGHDLHGWYLSATQIQAELIQLPLCLIAFLLTANAVRRLLKGTPMGEAFATFFTQRGIFAILSFMVFYRFGEAMVAKMAPLFLKDTIEKGGLAVPNDLLGQINGVGGVLGLVIGGILGGWVVSKFGLRKSFWPIVICMHAPNLLYVWASYAHPGTAAIYGVVFVDQFGYGFGFSGYIVYLMQVAQRGNFRTSHYAICTGLGAMFIALAGILSGIVQANFGYHAFFIFVIFATIPGMLTLLFIPLDERPFVKS